MTAREKVAAEELRDELFRIVSWTCPVCGAPLAKHGTPQLAHRIPRRQSMLMRWGAEVINSPLNMVPVCSLPCNDAVSLGTVSVPSKALLERIVRIQTGRESMPDLADYYRAVGKEVRDK